MPNTVPSDDARHRPLVRIAKTTYPTMSRPHSKEGLVPVTSQPGGSASSAETARITRPTESSAYQTRSPTDIDAISRTTRLRAARGVAGSASLPT